MDGTFNQSGARTVSTTVLCTCVRQARRSAETNAAGFRTDDISATRRPRIRAASAARRSAATSGSSGSRVRHRGGTLVGRQIRLSGVAKRGCEFYFSQAVCRNVQSVARQSAYAKDDSINRVCHKTQALCFLPADVIGDELSKLEQVEAAGGVRRLSVVCNVRAPYILTL